MIPMLRWEYVGFTVNETCRIYTMRVRRHDGVFRDVRIAIANESFLSKRIRYQDAPDICFLKLKQELSLAGEDLALEWQITDAELDAYRETHTKAAPPRVRPPVWS